MYTTPVYHPVYTPVYPTIPPWVYHHVHPAALGVSAAPTMTGSEGPGLKSEERPGWEPKLILKVLKVLNVLGGYAQSYSALPGRE